MQKGFWFVLIAIPVLATTVRIWAEARVEGEVRIAIWDCVADQLPAIALFGLLGPPIGLIAVMLPSALSRQSWYDLRWMLLAAWFSYIGGLISAIATGVVAGAAKPWLFGWRGLWFISSVGALLAPISFVATGLTDNLSQTAIPMVSGAIGGLACARLLLGSPNS